MSEPRIGRVLVASLHQAIADVLPSRLEFLRNWLSVSTVRAQLARAALCRLELPEHRGCVRTDYGTPANTPPSDRQ
jgi:hypothetical protein